VHGSITFLRGQLDRVVALDVILTGLDPYRDDDVTLGQLDGLAINVTFNGGLEFAFDPMVDVLFVAVVPIN
jgi:hypothetical protein